MWKYHISKCVMMMHLNGIQKEVYTSHTYFYEYIKTEQIE